MGHQSTPNVGHFWWQTIHEWEAAILTQYVNAIHPLPAKPPFSRIAELALCGLVWGTLATGMTACNAFKRM